MKKILVTAILPLAALVLASCGDDVVFDIPHPEDYDNLYFVQATSNPQPVVLLDTQKEPTSKSFCAFWSGMSAPNPINITFAEAPELLDEYNSANNKEYALLPQGAYTITQPKVTIPEKEFRTPLIDIQFQMTDELTVGSSYLLPLRLSTSDVKVREEQSILYYTVEVAKDLSPVTINGNVKACDSFFMIGGGKALLTLNSSTGELIRYSYNAQENSFGTGRVMHSDWGAGAIFRGMISPGPGNSLHVINLYANWISLIMDEDGAEIPPLSGYASFITGGCSIFLTCIPGHSDGFLAVDSATGGIRYYQITDDGLNLTFVISYDAKFNYWPYALRFCFNDDIYGVDSDGILWRHAYDEASHTWADRVRAGVGWSVVSNACQLGEDLLVRKTDGTLQRYPFDPAESININ